MARPKAAHGTPQRWRTGCHCNQCLQAHNLDTLDRRREAARSRLDPIRNDLCGRLSNGEPLKNAAEAVGTTIAAIHGRGTWDAAWAAAVDEALMIGRDPTLDHGTIGAYRHGHCRCPECREHHEATRGVIGR